MSKHEAIPASWATRETFAVTNPGKPWTLMHRLALDACMENAANKPKDCICCGCHTQSVSESFTDAHLIEMMLDAECPAEKRALSRIFARR